MNKIDFLNSKMLVIEDCDGGTVSDLSLSNSSVSLNHLITMSHVFNVHLLNIDMAQINMKTISNLLYF